VFSRKRLFRLLDAGRNRPITWLQGPPGAGKTTLIASYLESRKLPTLWYQVDAGDGDVATFFYHLRDAAPRRRRPLPLLTPEYLSSLEIFAQGFFRELFDRLKTPFAVVFDNYQDASSESKFQEVMREALGQIPEKGRVIVISRAAPPPEMARLRASRAFHQIAGAELRLTLEEARGLARSVTSERIATATLQTLHDTVDGWAAGLILMLERRNLESEVLGAAKKNNPQEVFDYFAGEIFRKSDVETREVLLQTAFLPRVTAPVAVELTGLTNAGRIIDDLAREHYFTNKHAASEPAYQYHPMFREFLLAHGRETLSRERRVQIQKYAAALLEKAGQAEDAIPLLREAEDWEGLARLIQEQAPIAAGQGRMQTVEGWFGYLPEAVINERPWPLYWRGICRMSFNLVEARGLLEKAFNVFWERRDPTGSFLAWSAVVESIMHAYDDFRPLDYWIEKCRELLDAFPVFPSIEVEAHTVSGMLGALLGRQPHHPDLPAWVKRALEVSRQVSHPRLQVPLTFWVVNYYFWSGEFNKGFVIVESLRAIAGSVEALVIDRILAIFMTARYEWLGGSRERAIATWAEGLELAERSGVHALDHLVILDFAIAWISEGDLSMAQKQLAKLNLASMTRAELITYHSVASWHAFLSGNSSLALSHLGSMRQTVSDFGMPSFEAIMRLFFAEVLHGSDDSEAARSNLAVSQRLAQKGHAHFVEYMGLLTQAHIELDAGNEKSCLEALARALALGREHGYVNHFLWRANVMSRLCVKALEAGIEVDYVCQLIAKRGLVPERAPVEIEQWPWAIKIYTLGRFSLLKSDEPVQFSRKAQRKPIDMLKALIAFGGREVSESQLMETLWPESEGDVAHQSLSTTLHRLRRLLGNEDTIQRQEGKLTLNPRLCWVDVWATERGLSRAEAVAAPSRGDGEKWAEMEKLVEKATALYQGPFLAKEEFPWATEVTDRVQRRLLRALRQIGRHHEQDSAWDKAIDCYERAVQVAPCTEELYRRLITIYQQQGRRVEALGVYERCRRTLLNQLGLTPSRETEALHHSLRSA
jgi:ATP/maltotriose-dependent transcriptional regulator MalT/DNA-binding SARP family transcriptional activator